MDTPQMKGERPKTNPNDLTPEGRVEAPRHARAHKVLKLNRELMKTLKELHHVRKQNAKAQAKLDVATKSGDPDRIAEAQTWNPPDYDFQLYLERDLDSIKEEIARLVAPLTPNQGRTAKETFPRTGKRGRPRVLTGEERLRHERADNAQSAWRMATLRKIREEDAKRVLYTWTGAEFRPPTLEERKQKIRKEIFRRKLWSNWKPNPQYEYNRLNKEATKIYDRDGYPDCVKMRDGERAIKPVWQADTNG